MGRIDLLVFVSQASTWCWVGWVVDKIIGDLLKVSARVGGDQVGGARARARLGFLGFEGFGKEGSNSGKVSCYLQFDSKQ